MCLLVFKNRLINFRIFFSFNWGKLLYNVVFLSAMQPRESVISPPSWASLPRPFPPPRSSQSWPPRALQQLPTSCLFHAWCVCTHGSVCVSATLSVRPTPALPQCVCRYVLYIFAANRFISTCHFTDSLLSTLTRVVLTDVLFPRAMITKFCRQGSLNIRNLSHCSEGCKW